MRVKSKRVGTRKAKLCVLFILLGIFSEAKTNDTVLSMEQVMTPQELKESGVSGLTESQRRALNAWLNRYTKNVLQLATRRPVEEPPTPRSTLQSCNPAIESTISGEFEGWSGETIFKLDNGQIWEQAEYSYTYTYSYRPEVTIYQTRSGCRMKVEGEDETILVRRIK